MEKIKHEINDSSGSFTSKMMATISLILITGAGAGSYLIREREGGYLLIIEMLLSVIFFVVGVILLLEKSKTSKVLGSMILAIGIVLLICSSLQLIGVSILIPIY